MEYKSVKHLLRIHMLQNKELELIGHRITTLAQSLLYMACQTEFRTKHRDRTEFRSCKQFSEMLTTFVSKVMQMVGWLFACWLLNDS
jgi:hypothetical protein